MYKSILKPLFFLLNPEHAHSLTMWLMKLTLVRAFIKRIFYFENKKLNKNLMGLTFSNSIGLAAGFDKHAFYIKEIESLGFGFTEIGTVTPLPQPGNDKPRLFRLPKDEALINRMGFNNVGADVVAARIKAIRSNTNMIIGVNIGKNKATPNEQATNDYVICFQKLFDAADYFAVNVSSPNTPNLRQLQDKKPLTEILTKLQELNHQHENPKPILLKIAPDLTNSQLDEIVEIVLQTKIAGVIATNTTISREGLTDTSLVDSIGAGGLSGKPVCNLSTEVIRYLAEKSKKQFVIIGVGGIRNAQDAKEKLDVGADLLQIYTGLIYEGPGIVKDINKVLLKEK